jgi:mono/diheme cytochrome c family protein
MILTALSVIAIALSGCGREKVSDNTPIHPNPNMDHQPKYKAQAESNYFEDGAAMRPQVEGTVAQGELREDSEYYFGKDKKDNFIESAPVEVTLERIKRGQERFNIFCAPCHGRVGDGQSMMNKPDYEYTLRPDFHSDSVKQFTDGYIFDVITNGVRNMPSYKHQISVDDRWSIVMYLRALQKSHEVKPEDVPEEYRKDIK